MTNLMDDSAVDCISEGVFESELTDRWDVWFPNGGYITAIALRCVGRQSEFDRPLSISIVFCSPAKHGGVRIELHRVSESRNTGVYRFEISQSHGVVASGLVTAGNRGLGYVHDEEFMPSVPRPLRLKNDSELISSKKTGSFWKNLELRPVSQNFYWQLEKDEKPHDRTWVKFEPGGHVDNDDWIQSMHVVVALDAFGFMACARAYVEEPKYFAPTVTLSVNFSGNTFDDWLFSDATAPVASAGMIDVHNRLWAPDGRFLARAISSLRCLSK